MTYKDLVNKYLNLEQGDIININGFDYIVIENVKHNALFLAHRGDHTRSFHLFYSEMNPETDNFYFIQ